MAHLLGAEALHIEYPTHTVFESVTLGVNEGDRIGIVGSNGGGKSTLLGMLSGRVAPDSGRVTRRSGVRFGVLDQSDDLRSDQTVGYSIVGDQADHEWASDPKIREVIAGLVSDLAWDATVASLSGGQRRRVALAKLLVGDWDLMALDEPNNSMGCSFRTPRFYRRGRAASRLGAGSRASVSRAVPCRTALLGKGGR